MNTEEQTATVNAAVARLAEILARKAELEIQASSLKTFIRLALGNGTHIAGDMRVTVTPRKIFDSTRAEKVIPEEYRQLVIVTEQRIDPARAKAVLPATIYDQCCQLTEAAVRIA